MTEYFDFSVLERGERFRKAIEGLSFLGSYLIQHDGDLALQKAGVDSDNTKGPFFQGMEKFLPDGTPYVATDSLAEIAYCIAKYRANHIPSDFIGPETSVHTSREVNRVI
jgi:hypothetical protein